MGFDEIKNFGYADGEFEAEWFGEIEGAKSVKTKKKLKELIILTYMPLAKKIAYNLARRSDDPVEDIIQVGSIGLIKAIDNYSPRHGASFKTYATYYITGEIRHYLRDRAKLVKVPREIYELSYRVNTFIKELTEKIGNPPTDDEIAQEMRITSAQVQEAQTVERRTTPVSMNEVSFDGDIPFSLEEKIPDKDYEEVFENFENRIILNEAIRILDEQEREIIEMNFFEGASQREIAERLGLTKMQVSRVVKKALKKLFDYITKNGGE